MSLQRYFTEKFLRDASRLQSEPVNSLLLRNPGKFFLDENTRFFGSKNWKNCLIDLEFVEQKAAFVSLGFAAICTDLNMQLAFPEEYKPWRSVVYIPCFGWQDFRPYYESPEKLLSIPVELGIVKMKELNASELAQLWFQMLKRYFDAFIVYISYNDFLQTMLRRSIFHDKHAVLGDFLIKLRLEMETLAKTL
jgi:hypothetical protein